MQVTMTNNVKKVLKDGVKLYNIVADKKASLGDSLGVIDKIMGGSELTKMHKVITDLTKVVKTEDAFKDMDKTTILNEVKVRLENLHGKKYVDLYEFGSNLRVGRTDVYELEITLNATSSRLKFSFKKYQLLNEFDTTKVKGIGEVVKTFDVVSKVCKFEAEDFRGVHRDAKDLNVNYVSILQDLEAKLEKGTGIRAIGKEYGEILEQEVSRLETMIKDLELIVDSKTVALEVETK